MFKRIKEYLALQRELDETKALLEEMSGRCCVCEKALVHFKEKCKRLASEKDAAQAKYADELQKRLALAEQVERMGQRMAKVETCVCCGAVIPEGMQVRPGCEGKDKLNER